MYVTLTNASVDPYTLKVFMDVITLSCMYIVVLFAFGSGIIFMGNEKIKARITCPLVRKLGQHQKIDLTLQNQEIWTNFWKTFETMFWALLGPGEEFKNKDDDGNSTDLVSSQVNSLLSGLTQLITLIYCK